MRIIICDDDTLFLEQFSKILEQTFDAHKQPVEIVCCNSGEQLFIELNHEAADVLFLDIEMPDEDGFSIATRLSKLEDKPLLVFTTSIETLVFESFQHEPIWYLLKRKMEQLPAIVDKIIKKIEDKQKYFQIMILNELHRFMLSEILYFESSDHYIFLHTQDQTYRFRGKLNDIEKQLDSRFFIRCHASYLVNCQYVRVISKSKLLLYNDIYIPISRNKLDDTQNIFMNYKWSLRI